MRFGLLPTIASFGQANPDSHYFQSVIKRKNPRSDEDYDRHSKLRLSTRVEKLRSVQAKEGRGVHERETARALQADPT